MGSELVKHIVSIFSLFLQHIHRLHQISGIGDFDTELVRKYVVGVLGVSWISRRDINKRLEYVIYCLFCKQWCVRVRGTSLGNRLWFLGGPARIQQAVVQ